jgi:hypothetical protein
MNKAFLVSAVLGVSIFISCAPDNSKGILGIEVPIGSGKVSDKTPYIISGVYERDLPLRQV